MPTDLYLETAPDVFVPWVGQPINETLYPLQIADQWSEEQLEELGLFRPIDEHADLKSNAIGTVQRVDGVVKIVRTIDMPALRQAAVLKAHAYGNALTMKVTDGYSHAEVLSWDTQEREARMVMAGVIDLPPECILPGLAEDADQELAEYAANVVAKANSFRAIARAAVFLRREVKSRLLDEDLDTPQKLADAVAALRSEADALAAQLIQETA